MNTNGTRWDDMRFYYAEDLLLRLRNRQFDCVAVVRGAYENDPGLVKCAEILVSRRDPEIFLILNQDQLHTKNVSDFSFEDAWMAFAALSDSPILYGGAEDAEGIVRQITKALPANEIRRMRDVPLGLFGSVLETQIEPLINNRQSFAFVGWQPHIGWIMERANLGASRYILKRAASAAFPGYDEDIYTSVDLVFQRDRVHQWLRDDRLQHFLDAIDTSASQLRRAGGPPYSLVRRISEYLQIPHEQCDRELNRLKFELRIDPWWYREIRNSLRGHGGPLS